MPVEIQCPSCRGRFRVPDRYAGKRVRCPSCPGTIAIPAGQQPAGVGSQSGESAQQEETQQQEPVAQAPAGQQWYLRTEDGQQYGPVSREELDDWMDEGRIDAPCQILCDGWEQWKWADEVYPHLAESPVEPQQAAVAPEENPLAAIAESIQPNQQEVNPYVSPGEAPGGMDMVEQSGEFGVITPGIRKVLAQTRPWVIFLAVLGFIGGGLMVLAGLGVAAMSALGGGGGLGPSPIEGLFVLLLSAVYLAPAYYLFRYGYQIGVFLREARPRELETALTAQKSFWKLLGILTLVLLGLYAVMIVILVIATIAG